jgi:uncharacterized protein
MNDEVRVIEEGKTVFEKPTVVIGFPDIGLVGTIALFHAIDQLKLKEIAYLESDDFPPVTVVHDGRPQSPIRIYGDKKMLWVISEIPIKLSLMRNISKKLIEWFKSKDVGLIITLGGIPHPKRLEIEKPGIYGISINDKTDKILEEHGIERFEEGLVAGTNAVILYECMRGDMNAIYLMSESHAKYPDPESAAVLMELLNKILGIDVDVKKLLETGEEIKIKSRDLMKRTESSLADMQKSQEGEIPMMYR